MRLSPRATPTHLIPGCRVKRRSLIGLERVRILMLQKTMDGVVGTYILRPNQPGPGSHVANAAYMVAKDARGLGSGTKDG